jgi:hypothetical protein
VGWTPGWIRCSEQSRSRKRGDGIPFEPEPKVDSNTGMGSIAPPVAVNHQVAFRDRSLRRELSDLKRHVETAEMKMAKFGQHFGFEDF